MDSNEAMLGIRQNPKIELLQKIRKQKEAEPLSMMPQRTPNLPAAVQGSRHKALELGKATPTTRKEKSKHPNPASNHGVPKFVGAFLDEFENSVKIIKPGTTNADTQVQSHSKTSKWTGSSQNCHETEMGIYNVDTIPAAISINDIKTYLANLCKPTSEISNEQKTMYLKNRLLLICEITKSLSRHLMTGRHIYSACGIANRMREKTVDIYDTAVNLINQYRAQSSDPNLRSILLDFLYFFSNVLISKDIGMTTYVIEQSMRSELFPLLLELSTSWTVQKEADGNRQGVARDVIPAHLRLQFERYLKDMEDQLTGTWKPIEREEDKVHSLGIKTRTCILPHVMGGGRNLSYFLKTIMFYI